MFYRQPLHILFFSQANTILLLPKRVSSELGMGNKVGTDCVKLVSFELLVIAQSIVINTSANEEMQSGKSSFLVHLTFHGVWGELTERKGELRVGCVQNPKAEGTRGRCMSI